MYCGCLSVKLLDSVVRFGKKYYSQRLFEECKYEIEKKNIMNNLINDDLDSNFSDDESSDEPDDESGDEFIDECDDEKNM